MYIASADLAWRRLAFWDFEDAYNFLWSTIYVYRHLFSCLWEKALFSIKSNLY